MMEIWSVSGWVWSLIGMGLLLFGIGYNCLVAWLEAQGYDEGYTALLVVGGVLVTLGGVALVDWRAAALVLAAFMLSGTPMVMGGWWRHVRARKRAQDALREGTQ
jgi:hypothetical protein